MQTARQFLFPLTRNAVAIVHCNFNRIRRGKKCKSCDKAIKEKKTHPHKKDFHPTYANCTTFRCNKQTAVHHKRQRTFPENSFSYETTLIVSNNKLKTSCSCMGLIKTWVTEMDLKPSQGLPIMLCYVHEIYNHRGAPWQIKRTPQPRAISVWFQMSHDQGNAHDWA